MKHSIAFGFVLTLILAGCTQAPKDDGTVPPGYEVADYCKMDSDCVRLNRCCDCGLGVYVNKYNQRNPDCTKEPVCECADIESKGECQNNRCVGVPIETTPQAGITEEDAKAIALLEVPGTVTDVTVESKFGKLAYVVEIAAENGPETDVIIDMETGAVVAVET